MDLHQPNGNPISTKIHIDQQSASSMLKPMFIISSSTCFFPVLFGLPSFLLPSASLPFSYLQSPFLSLTFSLPSFLLPSASLPFSYLQSPFLSLTFSLPSFLLPSVSLPFSYLQPPFLSLTFSLKLGCLSQHMIIFPPQDITIPMHAVWHRQLVYCSFKPNICIKCLTVFQFFNNTAHLDVNVKSIVKVYLVRTVACPQCNYLSYNTFHIASLTINRQQYIVFDRIVHTATMLHLMLCVLWLYITAPILGSYWLKRF